MNMYGKDFLKLLDFTPDEINYLIDLAAALKAKKKAGIPHKLCEGKNVALILKRRAPAPDAASRSPQGISAWAAPILTPQARR